MLFQYIQLLTAAAAVYNNFKGKEGLNEEEQALIDASLIVINQVRSILSREEFKTKMVQDILASDIADIKAVIGYTPRGD